jgi:amino acid transporter
LDQTVRFPDWLRDPHPKSGTTYRLINLSVGLQLVTILVSRGNVYILGDAYAFGVAWSFAMKALAVLVLRFKEPQAERWKVPLNIRLRGTEIPVGLAPHSESASSVYLRACLWASPFDRNTRQAFHQGNAPW